MRRFESTASSSSSFSVCTSSRSTTPSGQLVGIGAIFAFTFAASLAIWFVLKAFVGIRVSAEDEFDGVDIAECGIAAYPEFVSGGAMGGAGGDGTGKPAAAEMGSLEMRPAQV